MKKCGNCVYFLPNKCDGFNCGYFVKTVNANNMCCSRFRSITAPDSN